MNLKEQALQKIETITSSLRSEGLNPSAVIEKQYNYEIDINEGRERLKVLVYFGKKGIKTIIQGNEEISLYKKLKSVVFEELEFDFPKQLIDEPDYYIGSDESGKGDIFGPLVTAAVYIDPSTRKAFERLGIRDSKDLSDNQIAELASLIEMNNKKNYEIVMITPAKYNELYDKFKNLNKLLNWSHSKAIENLLAKSDCKAVITDKFENKDLSLMLSGKAMNVEFIQTPKAERYIAVAAASILARNTFNNWFMGQKKKGYHLPKGASDQAAGKAKQIFSERGTAGLNAVAKMHFKTIKKIITG